VVFDFPEMCSIVKSKSAKNCSLRCTVAFVFENIVSKCNKLRQSVFSTKLQPLKNIAQFLKEGYVVRSLVDQDCVKSLGSRLKDKLSQIMGQKLDLKDYHKFVQNEYRYACYHFEQICDNP
jgi:hypothetical protein